VSQKLNYFFTYMVSTVKVNMFLLFPFKLNCRKRSSFYHGMEPSHQVIFVLLLVLLWRNGKALRQLTLRGHLNLPLLQSVRFQHLMLFVSLSLVEGCLPKEQRK